VTDFRLGKVPPLFLGERERVRERKELGHHSLCARVYVHARDPSFFFASVGQKGLREEREAGELGEGGPFGRLRQLQVLLLRHESSQFLQNEFDGTGSAPTVENVHVLPIHRAVGRDEADIYLGNEFD